MDRRQFIQLISASATGSMAVNTLADNSGINEGILTKPHLKVTAKRVIFLAMSGGPSQFESFDYKPVLEKYNGKEMPAELTAGQQLAQLQGQKLICSGPKFKFKKYGQSGQEICELFPHIGSVADDIAVLKSCYTEQINHDPALSVLLF
jgi:hypothetical protein